MILLFIVDALMYNKLSRYFKLFTIKYFFKIYLGGTAILIDFTYINQE
jgi:hypothetical protein